MGYSIFSFFCRKRLPPIQVWHKMPSVMWLIQKYANSNPYFLLNNGGVVTVNVFICVNSRLSLSIINQARIWDKKSKWATPGKIKYRLEKVTPWKWNDAWKMFIFTLGKSYLLYNYIKWPTNLNSHFFSSRIFKYCHKCTLNSNLT